MSIEEVRELIRQGESEIVEFKEEIVSTEELSVLMAAFANRHGGTIVIGVNDRGEILGYSWKEGEEARVAQMAGHNKPPVSYKLTTFEINGKFVAVITVMKSDFAIHQDIRGRFPIRVGSTIQYAGIPEILSLIQERYRVTLERPAHMPVITEERKFDYKGVELYLSILPTVTSMETRQKLLEELRNKLPDLPHHEWTDEVKSVIGKLLEALALELRNEATRERSLDMLSMVASRADTKARMKMKEMFLVKVESMYKDLHGKQKHDALEIMQELHGYDPEFMGNLIWEGFEDDDEKEFKELLDAINFYHMNKSQLTQLWRELWALRSKSEQSKDVSRIKRIDMLIDKIRYYVV